MSAAIDARPGASVAPSAPADRILAETHVADGREVLLIEAVPADASALWAVIHDAFGHRPPVDPPPPALSETPESLAAALSGGFAVLALVEGEPAGAVLVGRNGSAAAITRVSVRPSHQRQGIASAMVSVVLELLASSGVASAEITARVEFPAVVAWWRRHGFTEVGRDGFNVRLARQVPIRVDVPTAEDMHALGRRLAPLVRPGDLLIAAGDLGAGKTTLTQGLGEGMRVAGAIISPTFVLSRVHPNPEGGPALVHVDAYRLGTFAELEDLDLEVSLDDSVTLVEWGSGIAEGLSDQHLEIDIRRSLDPDDEARAVFLTPIGARWEAVRADLESLR